MLFEPRLNNVIIPIVGVNAVDNEYFMSSILGTGFPIQTIDGKLFIVSARHVFCSQLGDGQKVAALLSYSNLKSNTIYLIDNFKEDRATDIAACHVEENLNKNIQIVPFGITNENVEQTRTVFVHEFSYTRSESTFDCGTSFTFHPITHKGNVVSQIRGAHCEHAEEPIGIYWLSEQMFAGASGAPVLRNPDMAICGIVLGNQVELDPTAYMAGEQRITRGFGVAVQASVMKLALDRMDINCAYLPSILPETNGSTI